MTAAGAGVPVLATLAEAVRVGVIQTSLDFEKAWTSAPKMDGAEEDRAISEIRGFMSALKSEKAPPDLILLPELAVPRAFEPELRRMASALQAVIIAGLDYRDVSKAGIKLVRNEAAIIVPSRWRGKKVAPKVSARYIGKTYPAPKEKEKLTEIDYQLDQDPKVLVLDGGEIGRLGVTICYDFLDLERVAMYRGAIHHLIVLAYNRDINSFDHAAEALARMTFCNVVVCNCGYYGGSFTVAPFYEPAKRVIYRHAGANLPTAQVISLPLRLLDDHQRRTGGCPPKTYKSLPAGYRASHPLFPATEPLVK